MTTLLYFYAVLLRFIACFRHGEHTAGKADIAWILPFFQSYGLNPEMRFTTYRDSTGEITDQLPYWTVKGDGRHARIDELGWNCQIDFGETSDFCLHLPYPQPAWWSGWSARFGLRDVAQICQYLNGGERPVS